MMKADSCEVIGFFYSAIAMYKYFAASPALTPPPWSTYVFHPVEAMLLSHVILLPILLHVFSVYTQLARLQSYMLRTFLLGLLQALFMTLKKQTMEQVI